MNIENGMLAKDVVSGFEGRVMGVVRYWTGCDQALLVPYSKEGQNKADSTWFDLERLEVIDATPLKLPGIKDGESGSGCDIAPPIR